METVKRSTKSHEISRSKAFVSCGFACFRGSYLFFSSVLVLLISSQVVVAQAQSRTGTSSTDIIVAQDGSGQFKTVQDAIMSVPSGSASNPVVIHIKPGIYKELIYIQHEKRFFHLVGEDAKTTILTFDLHANMVGQDGKPIGTFRTPSTVIDADDFIGREPHF